MRSHQTHGRSDHSLFGTNLENVKTSDLDNVIPSKRNMFRHESQNESFPIPEELEDRLSGFDFFILFTQNC